MHLFGVYLAAYWDWCLRVTARRPVLWMIGAVAAAFALISCAETLGIVPFLLAHVTAVPIYFAAGKNESKAAAKKERERFRSDTAVRSDTLKKMRAWQHRR
jgi:ABC-type transport system involved in cytochrome bd biosynthesis fused ATPase/permease subunit